jgi:hypothetical protein
MYGDLRQLQRFHCGFSRLEQVSEWRVKTDIVNVDAGSVVGIVFNLFHKFSTKSVFGFEKY